MIDFGLKAFAKKLILSSGVFRAPSASYCANNLMFPDVFVRTSSRKLRDILCLPASQNESQLNQDLFALLMNRFSEGYFLEIGANDGFTLSNTVYLEEQFNWTGLLVEANPAYQDSLAQRKSKSVIAAVTEQEGYFEFCSAGLYGGLSDHLDKSHQKMTESGSTISVWGTTLERILDEHDAPSEINFVSIDVEGAEVPIVEQMCKLPNHRFVCGCIEYNDRRDDLETMTRLLRENGYRVVWSGQTMQDLFFVDESRLVAGG